MSNHNSDENLTRIDFVNGTQFMVRGGKPLEYREEENPNPLLKKRPIRLVFRPDAPKERMFIELHKTGVIFWNEVAGVTIKSNTIFYGQLVKI